MRQRAACGRVTGEWFQQTPSKGSDGDRTGQRGKLTHNLVGGSLRQCYEERWSWDGCLELFYMEARAPGLCILVPSVISMGHPLGEAK